MENSVPYSHTLIIGSFLLCTMLFHSPAAAQLLSTDTPPDIYNNCRNPSLPLPTYHDFATTLAPTFWFSPDEPLLGTTPIPSALPPNQFHSASGHHSVRDAVVYYRLLHVGHPASDSRAIGHHRLPGVATRHVPLHVVKGLVLRYFAYYPADIASTGHTHDVEILDIALEIDTVTTESPENPCFVVRIRRIVGAAHGADWYANILDLDAAGTYDVTLPPYVLVEEASMPTPPTAMRMAGLRQATTTQPASARLGEYATPSAIPAFHRGRTRTHMPRTAARNRECPCTRTTVTQFFPTKTLGPNVADELYLLACSGFRATNFQTDSWLIACRKQEPEAPALTATEATLPLYMPLNADSWTTLESGDSVL